MSPLARARERLQRTLSTATAKGGVLDREFAQTTVQGYFDGELDAMGSAEFERHLETCAECQAELKRLTDFTPTASGKRPVRAGLASAS
jgi:hypothetical protein